MFIDFLQAHQLNIMLFLGGICCTLTILTLLTRSLSGERRHILAQLEFGSMLLLTADRSAYIYRGNVSTLGFWMVRVSNFLVYFCTLFVIFCITRYLIDLFRNEGGLTEVSKRLRLCKILFYVGVVLVIVSQFTGLYYTFDELNRYQRSPLNMLCFVIPVAVSVIHLSVVIQHRRRLSRGLVVSLVLNTVVPLMAGILQMFAYGLSLINISVVGMSVLLYVFALLDLEEKLETAHEQEHALFVETATALVNAIEKKDTYTRGHSRRVAVYSMMIAREAGKSAKECDEIYYAGLLHDVGKIGVAGSIINKNGRLTDEEFGEIKKHPAYGEEILRDIEHPYLRAGAQYHHERYDGKGYPTGLSGKELPEVARIIAVADSYDAMTSKRSYRDPLPQQKVREEIVKGIGTQFDPEFAEIMVGLIDRDVHYSMREID